MGHDKLIWDLCVIMQLSIQKEEAKKKEVHVEENVPAPSARSNGSVFLLHFGFVIWGFFHVFLDNWLNVCLMVM